MGLTGIPLLALFVLLTFAAMGAVVVLWPRVDKRSLKSYAGRVGLLAVAQLTLLATIAIGTNSYFGFYGSWSDLFAITSNGAGTGASAAAPVGAPITVGSISGLAMPNGDQPSTSGEMQDVTIHGLRTGLAEHALIYLPPQYFQPRFRHSQFPAAIVSTGYPGDVTALVSRLRYPIRLATGIALGQDKPMVLVMMSPEVVGSRDTECTNVPGGPQAETFWAQDVPDAVERTYRVIASAAGWGAIGDSTGGYCAVKLAMLNSDRFSAAASLSGYFAIGEDPTTGDIYGNQAFQSENDLIWRIRNLPPPPVSVLLATSKVGEENYQPCLQFAADAKSPMSVSLLVRSQGGHNFTTWNSEIPVALQWLSARLSTPPPQTPTI
jgi:enterochelin esterase-like enzyme